VLAVIVVKHCDYTLARTATAAAPAARKNAMARNGKAVNWALWLRTNGLLMICPP